MTWFGWLCMIPIVAMLLAAVVVITEGVVITVANIIKYLAATKGIPVVENGSHTKNSNQSNSDAARRKADSHDEQGTGNVNSQA